ncbi:hypothetical protein JYU34_004827 [Plutella xylostella]|uniref:Actin-related protein 10 n=1 Tax=Plutella xylostella TaxID=51655 RepID=A0ABQ7QV91_PLUXY|nr:hypothetical protein JYU34_004827 [Plutella xylostella]
MMPLYEGIALIQEKQAVVLDLGSEYTKFGFTGEPAPRCIVRSQFWSAAERRMKRVLDYATAEELYENLVHMLHLLYFRHVLVNPKERRVVVVESLLSPTLFRDTLAKVLFEHYEVGGVVWADAARLAALTLGTPCALVVDVGYREAEVTAVLHSVPLIPALQWAAQGAGAVRGELRQRLDRDNGEELGLSDEVLEDIHVKTLFVANRERACQWDSPSPPAPAPSVQYPVAGRAAITVSGETRERSAEVLFQRDGDMTSLPDLVLTCIMKCPIDGRRPLAENILVTGGGAALPGLRARLAQELRYLLTQPPYNTSLKVPLIKFHRAASHENCVAWSGGAALAGDALAARAVRSPRPDWPSLTHTHG